MLFLGYNFETTKGQWRALKMRIFTYSFFEAEISLVLLRLRAK